MFRMIIQIPYSLMHETLALRTITDRGQIADLLGCALRRHGCNPTQGKPARWGFGVIARRLRGSGGRTQSSKVYHAVEAVHVGSSDPEIASALAAIRPEDLILDQAMPGWEMDMRYAEIRPQAHLATDVEALDCYCISPIRVTRKTHEGNYEDLVTLDPKLSECLNETMSRRFERTFHLQILPDRLYIRSRKGNLSAGFAIKTRGNGQVIVKRGLAMPFTLIGPNRDLRDAWYSGLGRTTALGFGMLDLQS